VFEKVGAHALDDVCYVCVVPDVAKIVTDVGWSAGLPLAGHRLSLPY
jgi:hypothetical protein